MQKVLSKSDFDEAVRLLTKIFENIRNNVTEEKYRLLKKSNDKIAKLTSISEASTRQSSLRRSETSSRMRSSERV